MSWLDDKDRARQVAADRIEEKRAFKDYAMEQEASREYEALPELAVCVLRPFARREDPFDDYAAWQGMAPSYEELRR